MTYKLYLDDCRKCPEGWILAKDFWSFLTLVKERGFPDEISFDHDLDAVIIDEGNGIILAVPVAYSKTGMDCAKWLVEHDMRTKAMPRHFKYHVHSANPSGAENIRSLLSCYLKSKDWE